MTDKTLTYAERLILSNQFAILKKIDPEQAEYYDRSQEIVNCGYELFYGEINQSVYDETLPSNVSEEVIDILDMHRAIEFSCAKLGVSAKDLNAEFDGFDGNASEGHYGFAQFLRRKLGRWDELKGYPDNSHSAISLAHYRSMIGRWRGLGKKYELSADEIRKIAG